MAVTVDFYPEVLRYAIGLTGNRPDGEDLAQEVFERALKSGEPEHGNTRPWLLRIARNAFIDKIRRSREIPVEEVEPEAPVSDDFDYSPRMNRALQSLPAELRIVVLLCDAEGSNHEEVAQILNIPIGTVRSRLHRARNILRGQLEGN